MLLFYGEPTLSLTVICVPGTFFLLSSVVRGKKKRKRKRPITLPQDVTKKKKKKKTCAQFRNSESAAHDYCSHVNTCAAGIVCFGQYPKLNFTPTKNYLLTSDSETHSANKNCARACI